MRRLIRDDYVQSIESCIEWIRRNMITFNNGFNGIYERIRIDKNIRTNWVRPDCNAEIARVLALLPKLDGSSRLAYLFSNIADWLLKVQDNDQLSAWYGSFPFYLVDGYKDVPVINCLGPIFQNDNGKVLVALVHLYRETNDQRFLTSAVKLGDFWVGIQRSEGWFARKDGRVMEFFQGSCFTLWLATGLTMLWKETGCRKYDEAAGRAYSYVLSLLLDNGRMKTSYELCKTEDWRPVSSETAIALYAFSVALVESGEDRFVDPIQKTAAFVLALQDKSGGIVNCNNASKDFSLQSNEDICDLVYTQGYALMALAQAWKATGSGVYRAAAVKLANFLVQIQCRGESELWDGGWRGSYNVKALQWEGKADQNNPIDEGGMYSVYTGWCAAPIMYGMLLLMERG